MHDQQNRADGGSLEEQGSREETQEQIQAVCRRYREGSITLVGLLQEVSRIHGYLPEDVLHQVAREIQVPISLFFSLATFYTSFRLEPIGRKHVCVCMGTACHVRGADKVLETLERELDVEAGRTTDDGSYTLETVNCLGACAMGPLVTVNGEYHGKMDQRQIMKLIKQVKTSEEKAGG